MVALPGLESSVLPFQVFLSPAQMLRVQLASKKAALCRAGPQGQGMGTEMSHNREMGDLKQCQS